MGTSGQDRKRGDSPPTIRLARQGARPPVATRISELAVLEGPDRGRSFKLLGGCARIGKGPENEVVLTDQSVSRSHLSIDETASGFLLRDLGSTNGTWINGVLSRESSVDADATIRIGTTTLRLSSRREDLPFERSEARSFGALIGASLPMRELFGYLERAGPTDLSILLLGETGTGKELAAQAVHQASRRRAEPFVVFDCAACDPSLIAATLFGHREGAFTGATNARKGAFASAHRGTLFIDEVGELPLDLQPKLLRALERGEVQALGSDQMTRVDVRVVSATHRDLEEMVSAGKFREDLYFRLAGLVLELPALRNRPGDVALLARSFVERRQPPRRLGPSAGRVLEEYAWPGNVRELKNVIDRALALHTVETLEAEHLMLGRPNRPARTPESRPGAPPATPVPAASAAPALPAAPAEPAAPVAAPASLPAAPRSMEQAEKEAIVAALHSAGGNKSEAARLLGISRPTLREKIRRYGIDADREGTR